MTDTQNSVPDRRQALMDSNAHAFIIAGRNIKIKENEYELL